jgi:hypothetical protein
LFRNPEEGQGSQRAVMPMMMMMMMMMTIRNVVFWDVAPCGFSRNVDFVTHLPVFVLRDWYATMKDLSGRSESRK